MPTRSPLLFLTRFLTCFFLLYLFFPLYRGLIGAGGRVYFSFLDDHCNLVEGFTSFLIGSAKFLLQSAGYDLVQKNYHSLQIAGSRGISVNPSCLGWAVMSFWFAFVFADHRPVKDRFIWIAGGLAAIIALNISRISLIALANHLQWARVTSMDPHLAFNVVSYVCIIILICLYLRTTKHESNDLRTKTGAPCTI
jgi:exosortase/archaeosortase family protein